MSDPYSTLCPGESFSAVETRFYCAVPMGKLRRAALKCAILEWDEWASEPLIRRRARKRFPQAAREEGYGIGIIASFILAAVVGEVIAWAVGRLLDWWWDRKGDDSASDVNHQIRTEELYKWQNQLRQQ